MHLVGKMWGKKKIGYLRNSLIIKKIHKTPD